MQPLNNIIEIVEFSINSNGETYLGNSMIYVKSNIVKEKGSDLDDNAAAAGVNYWINSLF